jgi:hypothetical protein
MNTDQSLREHLLYLLRGGGAHVGFDAATQDLAAELRGKRPNGTPHSPWEILEHMRIAQWDILEFARDPKHVSPDWPGGYWPKDPAPPNDDAWVRSIESFKTVLEEMCELVQSKSTDLFANIPHGTGQTIIRGALLLADHNAYHLGELVLVRRLLGAWNG